MAFNVGDIVEGKVTRIKPYGAFVELGEGISGMVHISEITHGFVKEISDHLKEGEQIKAKIIAITEKNGISLSIKAIQPRQERADTAASAQRRTYSPPAAKKATSTGDPFEDMMNEFKRASDDKMHDLKRSMDVRRGGQGRRSKR